MNVSNRYRINTPHITHETIDGEVVIINFDSGCYYSLNSSGADIWEGIAQRANVGQIADMLSARYTGDRATMEGALLDLIRQLCDELLIVPADDKPAGEIVIDESRERDPFDAPVLEKFDDMQALLLLDPIHEVDETGWPVAKPESENG